MRTPLLAGNWKMFKTPSEAKKLAQDLISSTADVHDREILITPPFPDIPAVADIVRGTHIRLGAQNMHFEPEGAYTGEVSLKMILELGCQYVILGHSERRQYFHETNSLLQKKLTTALKGGIAPIFCIGETLEERKTDKTLMVLEKQVREGLPDLPKEQFNRLVMAYEPVWAIGTGENATPEQAEEVHAYVRKLLSQILGNSLAEQIRILYGGSVKPENIDSLMAKPNIDGALVGGASLKPDSFARIANFSYNPARV